MRNCYGKRSCWQEVPGRHSLNGLYGEAPPERGTFFRLEVYKRVGISRAEVEKRAGKTDIWVLKGTFKMSRTDAPNS